MTPSDKLKFNLILTDLADIYDTELSDRKAEGYWEALKDLTLDEVARGADVIRKTSKFFPKPVEFREQVLPDVESQVVIAYDKVVKAFWKVGIYRSVVFDDPVIHAVIEGLGGWVSIVRPPTRS